MKRALWGAEAFGCRELLSFVNGLPRDSAYVTTLLGARANWDQQAELIASVIDEVRINSAYLLAVNGNEMGQPVRFPRPGDEQESAPSVGLNDFANLMKE